MKRFLRSGVSVSQGSKIDDSVYYLSDRYTGSQWNISISWAALLSKNTTFEILSEAQTELLLFLKQNNLVVGMIPTKKPTPPFYLQLLFFKLLILKPENFLKRNLSLCNFLFSKSVFYAFLAACVFCVFLVYGQMQSFIAYSGYYLDSPLLIVAFTVIVKIFHEFGHACAVKRAGGRVDGIGVVLVCGAPLPITEASLLAQAKKSDKIICAIGGLYFEAWLSLICIFLWSGMNDGALRTAFHFVPVVLFSLTVAINILPLLKFDGYQLLSSAVGHPRLYEDAIIMFRRFCYLIFGLSNKQDIAERGRKWRATLTMYGFSIFVWKVCILPVSIIYAVITLFGGMRFSYLIALLPAYVFWVKPGQKEIAIMMKGFQGVKLSQTIICAFIVLGLCWVIFPVSHITKIPVAFSKEKTTVISQGSGTITFMKPSGWVLKGEILATYRDDQLAVQKSQSKTLKDKLKIQSWQEVPEIASTITINDLKQLDLRKIEEQERTNLQNIYAEKDGWWECPLFVDIVRKGTVLGKLYANNGKTTIKAFFSTTEGIDDIVNGVIVTAAGKRIKVEVMKTSLNVDRSYFPNWITGLNQAKYTVYTTVIPETPTIQEGAAFMICRTQYSLLKRFFNRLIARQVV